MIHEKAQRRTGCTTALALGPLLATFVILNLTLAAKPAPAATAFTVNSVANTEDLVLNGVCDVNLLPGVQTCTLRAALQEANASSNADTIGFNISGTGVKTITPTSALPKIAAPVTIDGYTQPGSSPNTVVLAEGTNARIMIELDGANTVGNGLEIVADDVVVRGLAIGRFSSNGIEIDDVEGLGDPSRVRIEGNFVGTNASGTVARPNRFNGLNLIASGGDNTIGGTSPFQRNLVSGNDAHGVNITPTGNADFAVEGNLIGTKKDGISVLGNDNNGVNISGSSGNSVGGFSPATANTIAFNGSDGVDIDGDDSIRNRILLNTTYSNGGLGINLVGGVENATGATRNDAGDLDEGSNELQNKPVVTSATTSGGKTTVQAKLNSTPSDPFEVEFFSNPSGNEGKKFLGNKAVSTNSNGNVTFTFTPSQAVAVGQNVTATATNAVDANTSEFSPPRAVAAP